MFVTVVAYGRRPIFDAPDARELLHTAIDWVCLRRPWTTDAMVLLPDHWHAIWHLPEGDSDYSTRVAQIKTRFTKAWLKSGGGESCVTHSQRRLGRRGVWQPRFWEHTIRDARDFRMHLDYIHLNPVHHGHVGYPKDWPWSSFQRWVEKGQYEPDWLGRTDLPGSVEYYWHDG